MRPKVLLEVTPEGWTWTVLLDGQIIVHQIEVAPDGYRGTTKGDIYDKLLNHKDLAEAIDERNLMGISDALMELEDD